MYRLFAVLFLLMLGSCQRQVRVISYQQFSPQGLAEMITNNIHYYNTAITSLRKDNFWKNYVHQFPDDLYTDKKYNFVFFPGLLQGGPFIVLQIDFKSAVEGKEFFTEHSKDYKLQYDNLDSLRLSDYCTTSSIPDSVIQQYAVFRFFDRSLCASNDTTEFIGGIYSGIFLSKNNKRVYCFAEDGRI